MINSMKCCLNIPVANETFPSPKRSNSSTFIQVTNYCVCITVPVSCVYMLVDTYCVCFYIESTCVFVCTCDLCVAMGGVGVHVWGGWGGWGVWMYVRGYMSACVWVLSCLHVFLSVCVCMHVCLYTMRVSVCVYVVVVLEICHNTSSKCYKHSDTQRERHSDTHREKETCTCSYRLMYMHVHTKYAQLGTHAQLHYTCTKTQVLTTQEHTQQVSMNTAHRDCHIYTVAVDLYPGVAVRLLWSWKGSTCHRDDWTAYCLPTGILLP